MIVTLKQHEIEAAVKKHIVALLGVAAGASFDITFTAGRGEQGLTATVDLEARDEVVTAPVVAKPVVQAAQAAPVAEPAAPTASVFGSTPSFAPAAKVEEPVNAVAEPVEEVAAAPAAPTKSIFG